MQQDHFRAFVPLAWGLMYCVFLTVVFIQNRRERARLYDMIEKATMEGKTVPPEILERVRRRSGPAIDIRVGLVLIAASAGMALVGVINYFTYAATHPNAALFYGPFGAFPIPGLIGVAFLIMGYLGRKDLKDR